jgi:hypothetical protein
MNSILTLLYICPITCEKIQTYAITCVGSLYEHSAIVKWLEKNRTDPLTNQILPTKNVKKIININNLEEIKNDFKQSVCMWNFSWRLIDDSIKIYDKLLDIKKNIDSFDQVNQKVWIKYNIMKQKQFINDSDATTAGLMAHTSHFVRQCKHCN